MTARRFAFVLLSLAPACVLAQSDAEDSPPPPEPRLEAYQALKGIDPAVWRALELAAQAGIEAKHARLPKLMEIQSITHMTVRGGLLRPSQTLGTVTTNTNRLSPLSGGFVLVESDYRVESENLEGSGKSTELRWLGFIVLYKHDVFNAKAQRPLFGPHESSTTSIGKLDKWGLSDLKLEEMKPGYRWKFEYSGGSSRSAEFKLSCEAAEGGSAATLAPELSGNFLKVTCENAASARPVKAEWAFLEHYGYFLVLGVSTERVSIQSRIRVLEATPRP